MTFDPQTISPHDQKRLQQILSDWKLTPATFAHRISRGTWMPSPHLLHISLKVAQAIQKGNGRIIISAPPRHGKSMLTSIYTPAWVLERFPTYKTILTGYGAELTTGFARNVRDIFVDKDNADLLKTRIRRDSSRVEAFLTEQGGGMYAVGLGGAITGRGANVLLIDDYIKEIKEALSPAYRDYIWNWFVTTAYTRLEPKGSCIIIATRWHSDDLIGRILQNFPGQWEYIEFPAVIETEEQLERDILGRQMGEVLFPERYPIERLNELKETLGSSFWAALFQQQPVDEAKKITNPDWITIVDEIRPEDSNPMHLKRARVWDLAATEDGGDYTASTREAYNKFTGNFYIENVIRKQLSPGQVETHVREVALADGPDVKIYIEQEPGSSGKHLVEHFKTNVLPEFVVEGVPAVTKKLVRAQPFIAGCEAGKVFAIKGAWNPIFLKEFDTFPTGQNDDQVDVVAAGYQKLTGKRVFSAVWGRDNKPDTTKSSGAVNSKNLQRAQFEASIHGTETRLVRGATFGRRH